METKIIGKKKTGEIIDLTYLSESLVDLSAEMATADEILHRKVSQLGNSGHISIPRKHIGKTARVVINKIKEGGVS